MNDFLVSIMNFRSIRTAQYRFGTGVTVVKGKTGAGKSSIIWAIVWCLYGGTVARDAMGPYGKAMRVEIKFGNYTISREKAGSAAIKALAVCQGRLIAFEQAVMDTFGTRNHFLMRIANMQRESNMLLEHPSADDMYSLIYTDDDSSPQRNSVVSDRVKKLSAELQMLHAQYNGLMRYVEPEVQPDGPRPTLSRDEIQQQLSVLTRIATLGPICARFLSDCDTAKTAAARAVAAREAFGDQDLSTDALMAERMKYRILDEIQRLTAETRGVPDISVLQATIDRCLAAKAQIEAAGFSSYTAYMQAYVADTKYDEILARYKTDLDRYDKAVARCVEARPLLASIEKFRLNHLPTVPVPPDTRIVPLRGRECPACHVTLYDKAGTLSTSAYTDAEYAECFQKLIALETAQRRNLYSAYTMETSCLLRFDAPQMPGQRPVEPGPRRGLEPVSDPSGLAQAQRQLELLKRRDIIVAELGMPVDVAQAKCREIDDALASVSRAVSQKTALESAVAHTATVLQRAQTEYDRARTEYDNVTSMSRGISEADLRNILRLHDAWTNFDTVCARNARYAGDIANLKTQIDAKVIEIRRNEAYLKIAEELAHQDVTEYINAVSTSVSRICMSLFDEFEKFQLQIKSTNAKLISSLTWVASWGGREVSSLSQISGGERDRLSIAMTVALAECSNAPILFFDETLGSVDDAYKSTIVKMLRRRKMPVVVISHDGNEGDYDSIVQV